MLWDRKKDEPVDDTVEQSLRRRRLNPELQRLINQEEEFLDQLYEGRSADSIDTSYRYAAYATRIKTLLLSAHRYVAYTSDIGESFRPVAHPWLVRSAYGVSWAYILGDVANEGYKAYVRNRRLLAPQDDAYRSAVAKGASSDVDTHVIAKEGLRQHQQSLKSNESTANRHPMPWHDPEADTLTPWPTRKIPLSEDYRSIMAERAVFQALASMGLPALTIHSVVKYSGRALKGAKGAFLRTWAPIGVSFVALWRTHNCSLIQFRISPIGSSAYPLSLSYHTFSISQLKKQFHGLSEKAFLYLKALMQFPKVK
ncbi:conserved hypothetical protein [Uncinocarpus reesii 1704]|uniref:Mitochondrial fission process protein 1 n=1 Tax=Uncinocarpus reesii (strain UAMH 1704) TaxID=336963 RepID=C4JH89_UNCRE|nr:uncharacterized protein UREG_02662 [Uncinocarpus reesii 1704]EEP77813.1 conserved hypothetical protein [Uncinocarpus reesii 1704]